MVNFYMHLRSRLAVCFLSTWNHPSTIIESSSTFRPHLPNSSQISYTHLEPKWDPLSASKGPCFGGFFPLKIEVIWALGIQYIYRVHMPRQRSSLPEHHIIQFIQSIQSPTSDLHPIPPRCGGKRNKNSWE